MKAGRSSARGRGFALPLVMLLSLTAALLAAVMLNRMTTQALTVERQLDSYRAMHQSKGLREVVQFWMTNIAGRRVADSLAEDGRAVDLQLADGSSVVIYFADGQGAMLSDLSSLREEDRNTAQLMLAQLRTDFPGIAETERAYGPVAISAMTAKPEVLQAAAMGIAGPEAGAVFARTVLDARATKRLTNNDLAEAATAAEVQDEARGRLLRAIITEPTLWRVTAEVHGAQSGRLLGRAEMDIVSAGNRRGGGPAAGQSTSIQNYRWIDAEDVAAGTRR